MLVGVQVETPADIERHVGCGDNESKGPSLGLSGHHRASRPSSIRCSLGRCSWASIAQPLEVSITAQTPSSGRTVALVSDGSAFASAMPDLQDRIMTVPSNANSRSANPQRVQIAARRLLTWREL